MADRPAKLPFSATHIIWASRRLTPGEKMVWYAHWALDRCTCGSVPGCACAAAPDRCYAGATAIAERLGFSARTVEEHRTTLKARGLLESFVRTDGRNQGWIAVMPLTLAVGERAGGKEAVRLAGLLDGHLDARAAWVRQGRDAESGEARTPSTASTVVTVRSRPGSEPEVRPVGGGRRGEGASSAVVSERSLPPAVTMLGKQEEAEDGVRMRATTRKQEPSPIAEILADLRKAAG